MTLSLLNVQSSIQTWANWTALEQQIAKTTFPSLSGSVILRRTLMMKDLQLMFVGECCGTPITVLSESFDDVLVLSPGEQPRLTALATRFLAKVDHCRERECTKPSAAERPVR